MRLLHFVRNDKIKEHRAMKNKKMVGTKCGAHPTTY